MRNKVDYGIDLGTTNSAIARIENGAPVIIKSDSQKDTIPSCVRIIKETLTVGDEAVRSMVKDIERALKTFERPNTFIEFKRTMGTSEQYKGPLMQKSYSSAELSAEVLRTLKLLVLDESISAVVVTIPAKFDNQQREDTMKAAKLAGFKQVQLLQEPVAAATAYGLGSQSKDGFWLVFDFGGGTFDAALIKAEEGILTIKDTEGDNWLGGKNLDYAIVDEFIIPYLKEKYDITSFLNDPKKKQLFRDFLKQFAETAKNQMSYKEKWILSIELGIISGDIWVDIEFTKEKLERIFKPVFQQAIDITKDLLKRNHLKGSDLDKLILVGGPTHSPILRRMLKEQVTDKVDTSVDPMTVVAKGAALYASTIDLDDKIRDEIRDKTKLQLDLEYTATSVETTELVNIKALKDKSIGSFPDELFAELVRSDGAWSSVKAKIGEKAALVEVSLNDNRSNFFTINVYDGHGNHIDCEPNQFTILQSIGGLESMQVLPSNICIVKYFTDEERDLIFPVNGLVKITSYPATGVTNELKTRQTIRPGIATDIIRIPIYEGEYNAIKTNPELNNLIYEVIITGESLPALLPEGSDVDITIKVDKSGLMKFSAYFPLLDYTEELEIPIIAKEAMPANELAEKIRNAKRNAREVHATDILARLENLERQLENEKGSADGRLKILSGLRKELLLIENLEKEQEWPQIEQELNEAYSDLDDLVQEIKYNGNIADLNISKIDASLNDIKAKVEWVIRAKKRSEAKEVISIISSLDFNLRNEITGNSMYVIYLQHLNSSFSSFHWKDAVKARQLINKGMEMVAKGNNNIRPILIELAQLIPNDELPEGFETLR